MFAWRAATGRKGVTDSLDRRSFREDADNDLDADDKALPGSILANLPGWCREGCAIRNGSRSPIKLAEVQNLVTWSPDLDKASEDHTANA
jgi:hypothetical protein